MVCYIDVHCHLDILENIPLAIENAKKNKVGIILANGLEPKSNKKVLELAKQYESVKACLGFYPPDAHDVPYSDEIFEEELSVMKKNRENIAAIGEVGMDFKDGKDKELQEKVFGRIIELSNKIDKPLIIHSRKAEEDVLRVLEEHNAKKVILHCFSGKKRLVQKAADLKYSFSIPTNVVRAQNFQDIIRNVSLSQLFCETDSPFLSPDREKQNEPSFVVESYKKIAEIKEMTLEEVQQNIFMNYQRLM